MPYVVGLTGGIGSGKSTVASIFETLGATLVDADQVSHQLTAPAGVAVPAIQAQFGAEYLNLDGSLNRAAMRQRIFHDAGAKQLLESIPASTAPYTLLAIPLLIETGGYQDRVQRVLVVDCPEPLQVTRTMERSQLDRAEVSAIMAAQVSRAERLRHADDIILNNGDLSALAHAAAVVDQRLLRLAGLMAQQNST